MPCARVADEVLHALAHLARGLVGERDREDLARPRLSVAQQARDAARQHARLARAGAGDDEQRRTAVGDGLALRRVEAREQVFVGARADVRRSARVAAPRTIGERNPRAARSEGVGHVPPSLGAAPTPAGRGARPPGRHGGRAPRAWQASTPAAPLAHDETGCRGLAAVGERERRPASRRSAASSTGHLGDPVVRVRQHAPRARRGRPHGPSAARAAWRHGGAPSASWMSSPVSTSTSSSSERSPGAASLTASAT